MDNDEWRMEIIDILNKISTFTVPVLHMHPATRFHVYKNVYSATGYTHLPAGPVFRDPVQRDRQAFVLVRVRQTLTESDDPLPIALASHRGDFQRWTPRKMPPIVDRFEV